MKLKQNRPKLAGLAAAVFAASAVVVPAAKSQIFNNRPTIQIDGSSTVFPITEAMAEEFQTANRGAIRVTVGVSGTGGGFKKFCAGETQISGASRPIKQKEIDLCAAAGIEFIELPVAYDAITVVINPENTWATEMTTDQLKQLWIEGSEVESWSDLNPSWPSAEVGLFGPGTDSGTFDYFVEAILGKNDQGQKNESRADYTASEDDNILVVGVSRNQNALGYFGLAYYEENKDSLDAVAVNGILPSPATVNDGSYPLARPIYIYIAKDAAENRADVQAFVNFYLNSANRGLISEVGYVPLPDADYTDALARFNNRQIGRVPLREGL